MKIVLKIAILIAIIQPSFLKADEGMWIPSLIDRVHPEMKKLGLKLSSEDIYSINNSSLKDAIIQFGGFCSGTIISAEGLLLTNHHCGFGQIQAHSTFENNILENGFWAQTKAEEKPNPGLFARFLIRIEDVTEKILSSLDDSMSETERNNVIRKLSQELEKNATEGTHYTARVSTFYEGNEFYLFVYETFNDVRLVGTPPNSIGKFGGDTDNWMWPRHTGDFALFRVYSCPDGKPAPYSEKNIPLVPRHYLPVSIEGVKEGDFAMILGYPGRTNRFATSFSIENLIERRYPATVQVRTLRLDIIEDFSQQNPAVRLIYANKQASIANTWKNNKGQIISIKRNRIIEKKQNLENEFMIFAKTNPQFSNVLEDIKNAYQTLGQYELTNQFQSEALTRGIELFSIANLMVPILNELEKPNPNYKTLETAIERAKNSANRIFASSYKPLEIQTTAAMLKVYHENVPLHQQPVEFVRWVRKHRNNYDKMANELYKSMFSSPERTMAFLNNPRRSTLEKDIAFRWATIFRNHANELREKLSDENDKLRKANRMFVEGLILMNPERKVFPNANSTMRLTYGQVLSYSPADAVHFNYNTTLSGVMEKENPNSYEFIVSERLKNLYLDKDFGIYGENNQMIVNFIFNGDITGGNSGSSVLNNKGEVIGLAFDGNWEAMSMDIFFHPELQRVINVDIRYVLFIMEKYAEAKHLIEELDIRGKILNY